MATLVKCSTEYRAITKSVRAIAKGRMPGPMTRARVAELAGVSEGSIAHHTGVTFGELLDSLGVDRSSLTCDLGKRSSREQRRQQMICAGRELAARGEKVTTAAVCAKCGVSPGLMAFHFGSFGEYLKHLS